MARRSQAGARLGAGALQPQGHVASRAPGYRTHRCDAPFYFKDPNGLQLAFCCFTRNLDASDARMQDRAEISVRRLSPEDPEALRRREPAGAVASRPG